ncbi:TerC family protein [Streptomyces cavernae]|uniref:TerC family protein n=1 Tax=Streptomyces cavernae TaxID=2259034 RepID=UPI0030B84191
MVGVLVALVLRTVFIAAGAAIISAFSWVCYLFGAFLIWTAWKLIQDARAGAQEEYQENKLLKAVERPFGVADPLSRHQAVDQAERQARHHADAGGDARGRLDGRAVRVDSIPAIYGLTEDPYLVFTANAFALMGLRQLYFLIGGLLERLVDLGHGLSVILGFIGVKLVLHALHESGVHVPEISIPFSLGFIVLVLAVTTATGLWTSRRRAGTEAPGEAAAQ